MVFLVFKQGMPDKDAIIAELTQQVETLMKRVQQLEEEVAWLKKDSHNSSQPPSSDIVKPKTSVPVGRKKRKRGGPYGHTKFTRSSFAPEQVDKVIKYELSEKDAQGLVPPCAGANASGRQLLPVKNKTEMSSTLSISPFLPTGQNNPTHNYCEWLQKILLSFLERRDDGKADS